jgi:predicted glycoside hydrolase/deacetylase ChbG (UPF0249 family)
LNAIGYVGRPMLIINADDMGASRSTTDPVLEGFSEGTITSTTAMVWMPDSERAASLAREWGLPVGLHLNLTMPFGDRAAPDAVRERQLALTRCFGPESWRRGEPTSVPAGQIAAAIADQLQRFREQFGEPTHLDGHHHVHVHPAVLSQLPRSMAIRPPLQRARGALAQRWRRRRFAGPSACLAFGEVHPALGGEGLQLLEPARHEVLEVMVHPAQPTERDALRSPEWQAALATLPLRSYRDFMH